MLRTESSRIGLSWISEMLLVRGANVDCSFFFCWLSASSGCILIAIHQHRVNLCCACVFGCARQTEALHLFQWQFMWTTLPKYNTYHDLILFFVARSAREHASLAYPLHTYIKSIQFQWTQTAVNVQWHHIDRERTAIQEELNEHLSGCHQDIWIFIWLNFVII